MVHILHEKKYTTYRRDPRYRRRVFLERRQSRFVRGYAPGPLRVERHELELAPVGVRVGIGLGSGGETTDISGTPRFRSRVGRV